jgi:hypothetical protein
MVGGWWVDGGGGVEGRLNGQIAGKYSVINGDGVIMTPLPHTTLKTSPRTLFIKHMTKTILNTVLIFRHAQPPFINYNY